MIFAVAMAAPVLEDEPLDPLQACIEQAGPVVQAERGERAERIALVVGVPCHDDRTIPSLQFSSRDALAMGEVFAERGYQVRTLTTRVERGALLDALAAIEADLPPDGELVVYFSGHGVLKETSAGLERFLVFSDTDLGAIETSGLSLRTLESSVQRVQARRRLVVQDSCYAAGEASKGLGVPAGIKALGLPGPALQAPDTRLYASRFYELATEDLERGGSVYTHNLIQALQEAEDLDGDGCVGTLEAHLEAARLTEAQREGYQHPEWAGSFANDGCAGPASRGVVLEDGEIRPVPPGRIRGERVQAGDWVRVEAERRWRVLAGGWAGARAWRVSPGAIGGELGIRSLGRWPVLVGVRGAWAVPGQQGGVPVRGVEGAVRAGVLSRGRFQVGTVTELGVVMLDPEGARTPVQSGTVFGQHGRVQVVFGPVYLALEAGVGVTVVGGGQTLAFQPTLAGGLGVQL